MSEARESYESIIREYNENQDVLICDDYITELKQQDKQNTIIIGEYALKIEELEQQNEELKEFLNNHAVEFECPDVMKFLSDNKHYIIQKE